MISRRGFLALAGGFALAARAQPPATIPALPLSGLAPGAPLPAWLEPFAFENRPRRTRFDLVADGGTTVLRARAEASAAGLIRRLRVDPRTHPLLAWRWKVANLPEGGDLARREGDDFAARLYLTFDLDPAALGLGDRMQLALARALWGERLPLAALCYVWDRRAPPDTIAPNAYTERVQMVVAESGAERLGRWVALERDVAADFRRAFGLEPPEVSALIVSADTDDTGATTEAWFGDAAFRSRPTS